MLPVKVQNIAERIGQFYLQKNDGDYEKAAAELEKLRVTKIEVVEEPCKECNHPTEIIKMTCVRVGMLIGRFGKNIELLEKFLGVKVKIFEEKDDLYQYLIPQEDF